MAGGRRRKLAPAAAGAAAATALALALGGPGGDTAHGQAEELRLRPIGSFEQPVHVAHAPRRRKLLYVVEQPGTIRVLRGRRKLERPFLNIRNRVRSEGNEEGLLSVALHPKFPRNRNLFVYYTNNRGDIQVDRYRSRPGRPTRAKRSSRRTVIRIAHPGHSNHNGGQLQFGPEGLLYLATGDGGGGGDPDGNAQNRRSLLGKLLRIRPRPRGGHRAPRTNPFVGRPGRNQIFSLGLRNPWRFSFDRATGAIWIGDVGQGSWEEVNHERRATARGGNFGWNRLEGHAPFAGGGEPARYRAPVHVYANDAGRCAVTGGYLARGRGAPSSLRRRYVYADFCQGRIRSLDPKDPEDDRPTGLQVGSITSFGEGIRGRLYVASRNGPVHRIVSR